MLESIASVLELTPYDVLLLVLVIVVVYKFFFKGGEPAEAHQQPAVVEIPPLPEKDMTVEELRKYNGVDDDHICIAVLGKIYDVTKGKDYYGPEGAYAPLAGHDATRALGTMTIKAVQDKYDDISDLTADDLNDAKDWADRFAVKYPCVGRLLKPGEMPAGDAQ